MHLDPIGYLFSVLNLSALGGLNHQVKDFAVEVDSVGTLKDALSQYPGFSLEKYRNNGYQRVDNLGIFFSKNVREYMFEKDMDPKKEGVMIRIEFEPRHESNEIVPDEVEQHILVAGKHLQPNIAKTFLEYVNDKRT